MPRPRLHDAALRARLLEVSGRLLAEHGIGSLTTRAVAEAAGTSTSAVYQLFGGKGELIWALVAEGVARLAQAFAEVPRTDDPVADLGGLGRAYRRYALGDPNRYELIFGRSLPPAPLPALDLPEHADPYGMLVAAVRRCVAAGRFADGDPADMAAVLWGLVHGLVELELLGRLGTPEEVGRRWDLALSATVRGYEAGPRRE